MPSAREKLNAAYVYGSLAVAALVGTFFQSFFIGALVWAIIVGVSVHDGTIRGNNRKLRKR